LPWRLVFIEKKGATMTNEIRTISPTGEKHLWTEEEKVAKLPYPLPLYVSYSSPKITRSKKFLNSQLAEAGFLYPIEQKKVRYSLPAITPEGKLLLSQHRTMTTSLSAAQSATSLMDTMLSIHLANQEKDSDHEKPEAD
jgi:hypothetical protein